MTGSFTRSADPPPRRARGPRRAEEGSGAVLVLACCATLTLVLVVALLLVAVVRDAHRARAAADLAALAAVGPVVSGAPADCSGAARIASLNGARMASCRVLVDGSVLVDVDLPVSAGMSPLIGLLPSVVSGRARAGAVQ